MDLGVCQSLEKSRGVARFILKPARVSAIRHFSGEFDTELRDATEFSERLSAAQLSKFDNATAAAEDVMRYDVSMTNSQS